MVETVDFVDVDCVDADGTRVETCAARRSGSIQFASEVSLDCASGGTSITVSSVPIITGLVGHCYEVTTDYLANTIDRLIS